MKNKGKKRRKEMVKIRKKLKAASATITTSMNLSSKTLVRISYIRYLCMLFVLLILFQSIMYVYRTCTNAQIRVVFTGYSDVMASRIAQMERMNTIVRP